MKLTAKQTLNMSDQKFTDSVIEAMGPGTNPRMRKVLTSLIQHIHDFARDVNLTIPEWQMGMEFINQIGQMSDDKRSESILVSDVLGLESLVDSLTYDTLESTDQKFTPSAIIGPFYREGSPHYKNGESIIQQEVGGDKCYVSGKVTDAYGNPVSGATIEVWHTAPNGLYEQQDENQVDYNLRGSFTSDENGNYSFICLKPTAYPIPYDGPAGQLLQIMERHPYRPSHIHWMVSKPGYRTLITQIYDAQDPYTTNDSTFCVKGDLIVDFHPAKESLAKEKNVSCTLDYNIALQTTEDFEKAKNIKNTN